MSNFGTIAWAVLSVVNSAFAMFLLCATNDWRDKILGAASIIVYIFLAYQQVHERL